MSRAKQVFLSAAIAVGVSVGAAQAQVGHYPAGCAARDDIVRYLESRYGETLMGAGRQSPNAIMELYVSETGSWTVIVTRPDGTSCPIAVGEDWRQLDFAPVANAGESA